MGQGHSHQTAWRFGKRVDGVILSASLYPCVWYLSHTVLHAPEASALPARQPAHQRFQRTQQHCQVRSWFQLVCDTSLRTTHKTHTEWEPEPFQRHVCVGRYILWSSPNICLRHIWQPFRSKTLCGDCLRVLLSSLSSGFSITENTRWASGGRGERMRVLFLLCLKSPLCYSQG